MLGHVTITYYKKLQLYWMYRVGYFKGVEDDRVGIQAIGVEIG